MKQQDLAAYQAAQQKWTRLTDADLDSSDRDPETLADCLRQRYGFSTERATQEAFDFCREFEQAG